LPERKIPAFPDFLISTARHLSVPSKRLKGNEKMSPQLPPPSATHTSNVMHETTLRTKALPSCSNIASNKKNVQITKRHINI